jgi:hypothetical protein
MERRSKVHRVDDQRGVVYADIRPGGPGIVAGDRRRPVGVE